MSIVTPNAPIIAATPGFVRPGKIINNITPFTYRDGITYQEFLESLKTYITDMVVPHVDESFDALETKWGEDMVSTVNAVIALLEEQTANNDEAMSALTDYVNSQVATIIGETIEIQDTIVAQMIENPTSATNDAVIALFSGSYADKSIEGTVATLGTDVDNLQTSVGNLGTALSELDGEVTDLDANAVRNAQLDAKVRALLDNITSQTAVGVVAIVDDKLAEIKPFSLESASLEFGMRLGTSSSTRVMQSCGIVNSLDGAGYYSQAITGTQAGRETTLIVRTSPSGANIGELRLTDAGHGTGIFLENDNGNVFVWASVMDHSLSGDARYKIARIPWQTGELSYAQVAQYVKSAFSGVYNTLHYDEFTGMVGVRKSEAAGSAATFSVHTLANVKANVWSPEVSFYHTYPANTFIQGWAYLEDKWYVYSGSSESEPTGYVPATIYRLNKSSGALEYTRNVDGIRQSSNGTVKDGFSEPEGLSVGRGYNGEPTLILGVSTGSQGGRSNNLWALHHGVVPFRNQNQINYLSEDTGWSSYPMETWSAGFSSATGVQAWGCRVAGGYLEMRGTINGPFVAGSNVIGTLREGFRTPRVTRGLAAKSMGSQNPSGAVRVEVNSAGTVTAWISPGEAGSSSWIDVVAFRAPMDNYTL